MGTRGNPADELSSVPLRSVFKESNHAPFEHSSGHNQMAMPPPGATGRGRLSIPIKARLFRNRKRYNGCTGECGCSRKNGAHRDFPPGEIHPAGHPSSVTSRGSRPTLSSFRMQSSLSKVALACWLLCLSLSERAQLRAQSAIDSNLTVSIEARVQSEQARKDIKGSSVDSVTQTKSLVFLLKGKPKEPETRVGKWKVYGRDLKDKELISIESGAFPLDLSQRTQTVETKRFVTSYTPAHSVASTRRTAAAAKKTPAEGIKYVGFVLTVTDDSGVVGEYSEPRGFDPEKRQ